MIRIAAKKKAGGARKKVPTVRGGRRQQAPAGRVECATWADLLGALNRAKADLKLRDEEEPWFRGLDRSSCALSPSLMWRAEKTKTHPRLTRDELDALENDMFFEFQSRARELHERGLSDWDYLFFMRHHGVPTRIMDFTASFGVAVYFAVSGEVVAADPPAIWVLNPYALSKTTWGVRDIILPKWLGQVDDDFLDYGDMLTMTGRWLNDGPVAIYPQQISDRMRAQRGYFTFHGNNRAPLDVQYPKVVRQLVLGPEAVEEARAFLGLAGMREYALFPDLDHLGIEVWKSNWKAALAGRRLNR